MTNGTSQGLLVVVAIIIFGIFVLISYLLFRDNLKSTLANIFTDGLEQAKKSLIDTGDFVYPEIDNVVFTGERNSSGELLGYRYGYRNSDSYPTNSMALATQIDIQGAIKYSIDTGELIYTEGEGMTKLDIPYEIEGLPVTYIMRFRDAIFSGNFDSKNLINIAPFTFQNSEYSGSFINRKLKGICEDAFNHSVFKGSLDFSSVQYILDGAFESSMFDGTLTLGDVSVIKTKAFSNSKFKEVINPFDIKTTSQEYPNDDSKLISDTAIRLDDSGYYTNK